MRSLTNIFAHSFIESLDRSASLLNSTLEKDLYRRPRDLPKTFTPFTIGEHLLRSAATIEQTFNGITTRLWDDPFEWTLPERLNQKQAVLEYIEEVRSAVASGISFIGDDTALIKEIPAPVDVEPIGKILVAALSRSEHYQGRAFAIFQMLSDEKLPAIRGR